MNFLLILVASFLGSMNHFLWSGVLFKALSAILPFIIFKINYRVAALLFLSLIFIFNFLTHEGLLGIYQLRGLLFFSGIAAFIVFDRYFFKGEGHQLSIKISNKGVLTLFTISLIAGNFFYIIIDSNDFFLNHSYFMNEFDRYRGYFPFLVAIAIITQSSQILFKLILTFVFAIIMFSFSGDRGSSVYFVIISLCLIFFPAKFFAYSLLAIEIFLRPLFLVLLKNFEGIKGSFLVKANGFNYLLNNLNLLGNGIQPPNQSWHEKIYMYGSYFSPADYALYGRIYELGFLSFLISIYFFIVYMKKGLLIQDKTLQILYLYILSAVTIGYGMSSSYYVLIGNIVTIILIFRLKWVRTQQRNNYFRVQNSHNP